MLEYCFGESDPVLCMQLSTDVSLDVITAFKMKIEEKTVMKMLQNEIDDHFDLSVKKNKLMAIILPTFQV